MEGPRILLKVGMHSTFVKASKISGKPVPDMITGVALIDTGAGPTYIDEGVGTQLGRT